MKLPLNLMYVTMQIQCKYNINKYVYVSIFAFVSIGIIKLIWTQTVMFAFKCVFYMLKLTWTLFESFVCFRSVQPFILFIRIQTSYIAKSRDCCFLNSNIYYVTFFIFQPILIFKKVLLFSFPTLFICSKSFVKINTFKFGN